MHIPPHVGSRCATFGGLSAVWQGGRVDRVGARFGGVCSGSSARPEQFRGGDVRAHGKVAGRRPTGMASGRTRDHRCTGHRRRGPGVPGDRSGQRIGHSGGRPACRQGRTSYDQGRPSYTVRVARAPGRQGCTHCSPRSCRARRAHRTRRGRRCRHPRRSLGHVSGDGDGDRSGDRSRSCRPRRGDRPTRRTCTGVGRSRQEGRRSRRLGRARVRRRVRPAQP